MSGDGPEGGRAAADRDFVARAARIGIIGAVVLVILVALLWVVRSALTPLVVALIIAYLFDPLIDRFEARRIPSGIAIFLVLGVLGTLVVLAAIWLVPLMQREINGLSGRLPEYIDGLFAWLSPRLHEWLGVEIPRSFREGIDRLRENHLAQLFENAGSLLGGVVAFFANRLSALVGLMVIPVIAYYLLVEFDNLRLAALRLVPARFQAQVGTQARRVDALLSGFIRGQLVVMSILALLYGVGFALIGIQLAAVIGVVAGLLSIIPYVGSATALVLASTLAILQYGFGADLLGFFGLLVAVPIAAVVQVFAGDLVRTYKASPLYGVVGAPGESPEPPDRV